MAPTGERRNSEQGNAWAVAEEIERLDVAGVVVTSAFVHRDEQDGGGKKLLVGGQVVDDFLDHALKEVLFRGRRVAVQQTVRLYEADCRQRAIVDGGEEIRRVLD